MCLVNFSANCVANKGNVHACQCVLPAHRISNPVAPGVPVSVLCLVLSSSAVQCTFKQAPRHAAPVAGTALSLLTVVLALDASIAPSTQGGITGIQRRSLKVQDTQKEAAFLPLAPDYTPWRTDIRWALSTTAGRTTRHPHNIACAASPDDERLQRQEDQKQRQQQQEQEQGRQEEEPLAPLPFEFTSAQGNQLNYILLEANEALFGPAVDEYLRELKAEKEAEDAMMASLSAEASSSDSQDWERDPLLLRRMAAVREAERGRILQEILYTCAVQSLLRAQLAPVINPALLGPTLPTPPARMTRLSKLLKGVVVSRAVADAIAGFVGSTLAEGMGPLAMQTPINVDRVQAARLYAGMLEFGYFARALESECIANGVAAGNDSASLISHADKLTEDELRKLCRVQTEDAWHAAIRHIGALFELTPNEDPFDNLALPYPQLAITITLIHMESSTKIYEHYNPPGSTAEAAAKARERALRGWDRDGDGGMGGSDGSKQALPEADLVAFRFDHFRALLLEAALLGAALWEAERRVQLQGGYQLRPREPPVAEVPE